MHPNRKYQLADRAAMAAVVREVGFGQVIVGTSEGLKAVHVPFLLEGERLRFHVGRGNAVHPFLLKGCEALAVVNGPDAYVSPDWYGMDDRVPTWNYVAIELNGRVQALDQDELVRLVDDISAEYEARLAPKPAWTRDKMSPGRFEGLLKAITGFEMAISEWRGTAKADQDRPPEVRARLAAALREHGDTAMAEVIEADW